MLIEFIIGLLALYFNCSQIRLCWSFVALNPWGFGDLGVPSVMKFISPSFASSLLKWKFWLLNVNGNDGSAALDAFCWMSISCCHWLLGYK